MTRIIIWLCAAITAHALEAARTADIYLAWHTTALEDLHAQALTQSLMIIHPEPTYGPHFPEDPHELDLLRMWATSDR